MSRSGSTRSSIRWASLARRRPPAGSGPTDVHVIRTDEKLLLGGAVERIMTGVGVGHDRATGDIEATLAKETNDGVDSHTEESAHRLR